MIEVAALSWIVELPRDLGLKDDLGPQLMNNQLELDGWRGRYEELPEWSEGPPDAAPIKRLRFGRAYADTAGISPTRPDFVEMLNDLDLWIQGYGVSSGQVDIGALALHDLPALIPWV